MGLDGEQPVLGFEDGHKTKVFQAKSLPDRGGPVLATCSRDGQVQVAQSPAPTRGENKVHGQAQGASHSRLWSQTPRESLTPGEDAVVFTMGLR